MEGVAGDDHEVVKVQVRIDGGPWHDAFPKGPPDDPWSHWIFEWDTRNHDNGRHVVEARAIDNTHQESDIFECAYFVKNLEDHHEVPILVTMGGASIPILSMGFIGLLGAALVRRIRMGPIL
jgi:hypothetical protein